MRKSLRIKEVVIPVRRDRLLSWRQGIYARFGWGKLFGFEKVYSFTIVRNPWDRAISAWKNHNSFEYISLADYLRHPFLSAEQLVSMPDREFTRQANYEWHNMPQLDYITSQGKIVVKEIFRFENLADHWCEIQTKTGIYTTPLLHLNRTERRDYRYYYDDESYELVIQRYARDIREFGYSFDGVH